MTLPDQAKREIVGAWLFKAQCDFGLAELMVDQGDVYPSLIAFHCQQAAEKYIKALLTWSEIDFPKTHDLEKLLDLVARANRRVSEELREVIALTPYGVEIRYPGDRPEASPNEARQAVALARLARDLILPLLPEVGGGG